MSTQQEHIIVPWLTDTREVPSMPIQEPASSPCSFCFQTSITSEYRADGLFFRYCMRHWTIYRAGQASWWQRYKMGRLVAAVRAKTEHEHGECMMCRHYEVPCKEMERLERRIARLQEQEH